MSFRDQIKIARLIGAKDFDGAIQIMTDGLTNSDEDAFSLEMIAQCHQWAGRDDMAIATAKRALELSPSSFDAIQLLSRIYAHRDEHEIAARYARLGLDNFPNRLPEVSQAVVRFTDGLLRFLGIFSPRFKRAANDLVSDPNSLNDDWYKWAKQYLKWYENTYGDPVSPKIH